MKKTTLAFMVLISMMHCCPVFGQEKTSEIITPFNETQTQVDYTQFIDFDLEDEFIEQIKECNSVTKYCTGNNVNVRKEPNIESVILGQLMRNTSVEVIAECENWDCITTQDGIAFVYNTYLSDEEVPKIMNRWGVNLSDEEFDILCRIVMLESGNQSDLGQQAVTEVILNRVLHPYYPNDVIGVLSHVDCGYRQFSTWKLRNNKSAIPSEKVKQNVKLVLSGQTNILPYETVYFSRKATNNRVQITIEDHTFCNY